MEQKERQKMWFVTSVRVVPVDQRKPWFSKWWQRNLLPILRAWQSHKRRKLTWKEFGKELVFWWKDHQQMQFPIDNRTWGFYADKETALKAARENWSDLREGAYYKYVVVEGLPEGIWPDVADEDRFFFRWACNEWIDGQLWDGHWRQLDSAPQELIDLCSQHSVSFQFTSL